MKIVITCPRYFSEIKNLEKSSFSKELHIFKHNPANQGFTDQEMKSILQDTDVAIVGDDHISGDTINNLKKLKLIIKWGVGVDNIEIDKNSNSPLIKNSPADLYIDVAEHTIFLIGSLYKQIPYVDAQIKNKNLWTKPTGNRIANKNIGLIGYGMIGKQISKILSSFGASVFYYDPNVEVSKNETSKKVELKSLAEMCDVIIVSASLTKESENLINKEFFNSLQKKPIIINISRGKIINEDDLISALSNNLISGCALDVFEEEPISKDNKLKKYDNVVFSSHNASNTIEANTSVNNQVTKTLLKWLEDVH